MRRAPDSGSTTEQPFACGTESHDGERDWRYIGGSVHACEVLGRSHSVREPAGPAVRLPILGGLQRHWGQQMRALRSSGVR